MPPASPASWPGSIPCVLVTDGPPLPPEVAAEAERAGVPLLRTPVATPIAIARLTSFLEDILAERTIVHAVLMDILGLGVLIVGESGIGKSECALDLVLRGHRLVADDTVEIRRRAESVLIGACPELTRHHMEIRGLGVINIRDLFGVASTRSSKRVELVVQLERWETGREYERLGLDDQYYELLGLQVPLIRMPVAPGRSVANLVEVAARNQLLRSRGHHAAQGARRPPAAAPARRRQRARRRSRTRLGGAGERLMGTAARTIGGPAAAQARFVVLTGLSGAGKSQAIRALEDLGYFCVDNLPTMLIPTMAELASRAGSELEKVAIVVDVREGAFLSAVPEGVPADPADAGAQAAPDLPRGPRRRAGAPLQRDAPARIRSRTTGRCSTGSTRSGAA